MQTITIIGAGWLGRPLAHYLEKKHYRVFASRTTHAGAKALTEQGLNGFYCDFNANGAELAEICIQQKSQVIIGCFPPGFRKHNAANQYVHCWSQLIKQARQSKIQKIIMISSTGVYPDLPDTMTEDRASLELARENHLFSEKARILLAAEQQVVDSGLNYTILRCSGLFGPNRHPSRFVPHLKQISSTAPANMLHLDDAMRAILFAIEHLSADIVNVTTPETVSKAVFYQAALKAAQLNTPMPPLTDKNDKRIICDKLCRCGFKFRYQRTLDALTADAPPVS